MEISINVDEETFQLIKDEQKNTIEIWKTKFKNNLSCYDTINIIKWQSKDKLVFPIQNIIVEPQTTKYKIIFGLKKNNYLKNFNFYMLLFFILFIFSFILTLNYQIETEYLKTENTSLQVKNIQLEKRMRVCLYE